MLPVLTNSCPILPLTFGPCSTTGRTSKIIHDYAYHDDDDNDADDDDDDDDDDDHL